MKSTRHVLWLLMLLHPLANAVEELAMAIYTEDYPPYNFSDAGTIRGINIELVDEICRMSGLICRFEMLPWKRAMLKAEQEPYAGLISTSRIPERENRFQWVGPFVSSPACFYKLKARTDIAVENRQALLRYTIGVTRGDVYETLLKKWGFREHENYLTYSNKNDDVQMFVRGKLDLLISSAILIGPQMNSQGLSVEEVEPVFEFNDPALQGNFLALSHQVPKDVVIDLQVSLDRLREQQGFEQVLAKYGHPGQNAGTANANAGAAMSCASR